MRHHGSIANGLSRQSVNGQLLTPSRVLAFAFLHPLSTDACMQSHLKVANKLEETEPGDGSLFGNLL
jgi:hypothetical protein